MSLKGRLTGAGYTPTVNGPSGSAASGAPPAGPSPSSDSHEPDAVAPVPPTAVFEQPRAPELSAPPLALRVARISHELKVRVRDQLIEELGPDVRRTETP